MKITSRHLTNLGACRRDAAWFRRTFPRGVEITEENIRKVLNGKRGVGRVYWLMTRVGHEDAWSSVTEAINIMNAFIDLRTALGLAATSPVNIFPWIDKHRVASRLQDFKAKAFNGYRAQVAFGLLSKRRAIAKMEKKR